MGTMESILFLGIQVACGGRASVCAKPSFCPGPCLKPVTTGHTLDGSSTSFISACQHLFSHVAWFVSSDPCLVPETATPEPHGVNVVDYLWSLLGGESPGILTLK